jgi:hypothetical protein
MGKNEMGEVKREREHFKLVIILQSNINNTQWVIYNKAFRTKQQIIKVMALKYAMYNSKARSKNDQAAEKLSLLFIASEQTI